MRRGNGTNPPAGEKRGNRTGIMLACCILLSGAVCEAQIIGNTLLLTGVLALFLVLAAAACGSGTVLPVLLYFLPWSPLMKLYRGGISWFTIAMLLCCVLCFLRRKCSFRLYQVTITAALLVLTLTGKMLQGGVIENNYLFFMAMLLLYPGVIEERGQSPSFWWFTLFFACGIITAALSAQVTAGYSNIARYITVDSYLTITRLSGYYGDPNFYSAHITACLAGVMLLLSREKRRRPQLVLAVLAVVLVYCGLLSASKSFAIVLACLVLFWIPILMQRKNRGSARARLLLGILCAVGIMLSSSAFRSLLQIMDDRFMYATNISQLTTGRTVLWARYLHEFSHNALLTLFGQGFTNVNLNGRASHNTVIQGIYQFGLIGFPLVLAWLAATVKKAYARIGPVPVQWKAALLMCVGVLMPWMGLDLLFFDELFLLPVYAAVGVQFFSEGEAAQLRGDPPRG